MSILIGLFLDHAINGSNVPVQEPIPLVYNYGSFNQLFAWHNTSIGDM